MLAKAIIPTNLKVNFDMSKSFPDLDEETSKKIIELLKGDE